MVRTRAGPRVVLDVLVVVRDVSLGASAVSETITVSAAAPVVDTVSSALGTVVEQKQIAELPPIDPSDSRLIVLITGGLHDERVALPAPGRISSPAREIDIVGLRQRASVRPDRPESELLPNPAQLLRNGSTRKRSVDAMQFGAKIVVSVARRAPVATPCWS